MGRAILSGKIISYCVIVGDQPIDLVIQDPSWMAQIIEEGVDQITSELGQQVWCQTLLQAQRMGTLNMMNSHELNSLMSHMFRSISFYPTTPYLSEIEI